MYRWENRSMTELGVCGSITSRLWIGFGAGASSWRWAVRWPSAIAGIELHGAGKSRPCLRQHEQLGEKWHESVSPAPVDFYRGGRVSRGWTQAQPSGNSVPLGREGRT